MNRAKSITIVLVAVALIGGLWIVRQGNVSHRDTPPPNSQAGNAPMGDLTASATSPKPKPTEAATYVGRQVCKECHSENFDLHAHSGHASTITSASDPRIVEKFVGCEFDAGEPYGTFRYFLDDHGLKVRRTVGKTEETFPLQYALGSGEHGITLLTLIDPLEVSESAVSDSGAGVSETEQEPVGIEHRVTWFSTTGGFGRTPGHEDHVPRPGPEMFGETQRGEVLQSCISCHSTTGTVVGKTIVDHVPNVNCEKCHGPGSEHVREARASDSPPPFSIGQSDWTTESELRLCGSCHRLPQDMTRRQLRDYATPLVRFQPIGLLRSECYLQSEGELKCTTCHNPHMTIKKKSKAAYVQDCIDCHLEDSDDHVSCPVSPTQGCIECHMKAIPGDQGVAFHDHWIRVFEDD